MPYNEKFSCNWITLGKGGQDKIRNSVFCIIGLGGTGGFALENLVRMGAERLFLFDHDRFELGNFNRQILATDSTLDMRKCDCAVSRARSINNNIKIKKFVAFGKKNSKALIGADVVIDCTDRLATKCLIAKVCKEKKIPYVFCSAERSKGIVSVFSGYDFRRAFGVDEGKLRSGSCNSVLCPAAAIAGSLAAAQAANLVLGRPAIKAPEALFFDIFDRRVFWKARLG